MTTITPWLHPVLLLLVFLVGGLPPGARATETPPFEPLPEGLDPAAYLEFGASPDNRCMLLSPGGKLAWARNRHPSMALRFRLIRLFAGVPQGGRAAGLLPPGPEGTHLGCNLVTGREQRWEIDRLSLVPWQPPAPDAGAEAGAITRP